MFFLWVCSIKKERKKKPKVDEKMEIQKEKRKIKDHFFFKAKTQFLNPNKTSNKSPSKTHAKENKSLKVKRPIGPFLSRVPCIFHFANEINTKDVREALKHFLDFSFFFSFFFLSFSPNLLVQRHFIIFKSYPLTPNKIHQREEKRTYHPISS